MSVSIAAVSIAVIALFDYSAPQDAPFLESEMVCPENGPYPFSHGSTLVELPDGRLFCAWYAGSAEKASDVAIVAAERAPGAAAWSAPRVIADTPDKSEGNPVLFLDPQGKLWLFYQTMLGSGEGPTRPGTGWATCQVKCITSEDGGRTWSAERMLIEEQGYLTRNKLTVLRDGTWVLPLQDERDWSSTVYLSKDQGQTWRFGGAMNCGLGFKQGNIEPALLERNDGSLLCFMRTGAARYRTWKSVSHDGGQTWTAPREVNIPNPNAALDLLRLPSGNVLMALNPIPEDGRQTLSLWLSLDDGETFPIRRDMETGPGRSSYPALILAKDGRIHLTYSRPSGGVKHAVFNEAWVWQDALLGAAVPLANVVPPLDDEDDPRSAYRRKPGSLPVKVGPIEEHVRRLVVQPRGAPLAAIGFDATGRVTGISAGFEYHVLTAQGQWDAEARLQRYPEGVIPKAVFSGSHGETLAPTDMIPAGIAEHGRVTAVARQGDTVWIGTDQGLFLLADGSKALQPHSEYGVDGPLSTRIQDLAVDSCGALWVGTLRGLSRRDVNGQWTHFQGKQGLPVEAVTSLAIDTNDRLWIGTERGVVHFRPYEEGRQWFYRGGERYLPGDTVFDIAVSPDTKDVYIATDNGVGRIEVVTITLLERAQTIERLINERHRRLGLVAECDLDDPFNPTKVTISDNDNDGLWTAYHVAAMSLCYGATGDEAALESAMESMRAIVMLQNASGVPGLVARTVLPIEEARDKSRQWQVTPDGKMKWKSDTSSDEIDGHYLAFYTYWEHIARFIPSEREIIIKQVRDVTDYLIQGNYQLIDWTGRRTRWGFWNPESLNDDPVHYLENGLNSLQMLSFLKVAHYITGDPKYKARYRNLAVDHHYVSNALLSKKVFPDMNNHSDDQLGFVAWYPILQLEWDPAVRQALLRGVRRHYKIVAPEKPSFYIFAYATIDPDYADIEAGVEGLTEIPTDRRDWRMGNSHRDDVVFDVRSSRFGRAQLQRVLPADERAFAKWNRELYEADLGSSGTHEDDGAAYLLPYWMGRLHGFIEEAVD